MLLNRHNGRAITPFHSLSHELDRMFGGFLDQGTAKHRYPAVRVWESEGGFEIQAEMPGVRAEDLDVSVHGNRVSVRGERKDAEPESHTSLRQEWGALTFERSFDLPVDVDDKGVEAILEEGILRLTLPKAAGHKPQKIKVLAAK